MPALSRLDRVDACMGRRAEDEPGGASSTGRGTHCGAAEQGDQVPAWASLLCFDHPCLGLQLGKESDSYYVSGKLLYPCVGVVTTEKKSHRTRSTEGLLSISRSGAPLLLLHDRFRAGFHVRPCLDPPGKTDILWPLAPLLVHTRPGYDPAHGSNGGGRHAGPKRTGGLRDEEAS